MGENLEVFLKNPWLYILGLLLIGSYSFFKKKFENLADKDDVGALAREVESVKKEFNEDLEKLKTNLDVIKSNRINLINEKRKSIYEFWVSLTSYMNKLDYFLGVETKNYDECIEYSNEIDMLYFDLNGKLGILDLVLYSEMDEEIKKYVSTIIPMLIYKEKDVKKAVIDLHRLKQKKTPIEDYSNRLEEIQKKVAAHLNKDFIDSFNLLKAKLSAILIELHKADS